MPPSATCSAELAPLRAVVLADACGGRASPFPSTSSRAYALPLHGSSILQYQLYALATTGVAEALVLSSGPLPCLPSNLYSMAISSLRNPSWRSHGDALRDLESRQSLRPTSDFLLVHPGSLFNISASDLIRSHVARTAADKNWLVSLLFRRDCASSPLTIASQFSSGALCLYARTAAGAEFVLDSTAENVGLLAGGGVCISSDVADVGLDVCSPEFLLEFRENFDFDNVRDYVRAKLDGGAAELLGNRMHARFVDDAAGEFASAVDSFAGYLLASRCVADGWLAPIRSPAVFRALNEGAEVRRIGARSLSLSVEGRFADVDLTAVVAECTVVGRARIEANAIVEGCVVGDGVIVGTGAEVRDAVLCSGVVVAAGAKVNGGLLREESSVAAQVVVPYLCYLDTRVVIGPGGGVASGLEAGSWIARVVECSKVASTHGDGGRDVGDTDSGGGASSDSGGEEEEQLGATSFRDNSHELLGVGGEGRVLLSHRRSEFYLHRRPNSKGQEEACGSGWPSFLEPVLSDSDDEFEREGTAAVIADDCDLIQTKESSTGDGPSNVDRFYDEMCATIEHGVADSASVQTIALEVSSLRLSCEVLDSHASVGVIRALAALVHNENKGGSPAALMSTVKVTLQRWRELLDRFSVGESESGQRGVVNELSKFLARDGRLLSCFLKALYDMDVLEEEAILSWANEEREAIEAGRDPHLFEHVRNLVEWLEDAEEASEEED